MVVSIIDTQRDLLLDAIRNTGRGEWKVLVLDPTSRKLLFNVLKEDDILNQNITNIEQIDEKRPMNRDMDVLYILTPEPWVVDCLMADFERGRYRDTYLIWTSLPNPKLRERIDRSNTAQQQIRVFKVINADFYPRESHLVTFRDPWSFPILFHPACNNLIRKHMEDLANKIVAVCISLDENPIIRYYRPRNASHEASVLCTHLARFVQEQLDMYAQYHPDFPAPSNRPRGALYIVDRSIDLFAPLLHEFTYQAMAFDLLKINDGDRISYKTIINEGQPDEEEKEIEISDKDKIWVENRHTHMKDTIEKLMGDFQRFIHDNPHFTNSSSNATSLNAIKDMLAGLPQFQEMKEAYSLHLSMAQECMNIFQEHKLPEMASIEQSLATGLDEDYRKPKNVADQVVRTLDEENVTLPDRLRLIALYILFKNGLLQADIIKLLAHAQLPPQDGEVLNNLELLGARVYKALKDTTPAPTPIFPRSKPSTNANEEEYALSRFITSIKALLEDHVRGTLDTINFPFTKPDLAAETIAMAQESAASASLRSAKPTWAKGRLGAVEPRQRVIVFVAGGATYSESRACYEVSRATSRDIFLVSSHMITPSLFMRQIGDLSVDKRRLNIPLDMPPKKAPAHILEQPAAPGLPPAPQAPGSGSSKPLPGGRPGRPGGLPSGPRGSGVLPPTKEIGAMNINSGPPSFKPPASDPAGNAPGSQGNKLTKELKNNEKDKKRHFFSSKR